MYWKITSKVLKNHAGQLTNSTMYNLYIQSGVDTWENQPMSENGIHESFRFKYNKKLLSI